MRPTVLLFDIDGTLVTTGGVGRRAIELTFARFYDRPDACSHIRFDGMTDRAIFRAGLTAIGHEASDAAIDELIAHYLTVLEEEVERADMANYKVHPGIVDALEKAGRLTEVAIGLGTGNIRDGARLKLARVGIYDHFAFGGFGCDAENRTELIRAGADRGAAKLGRPRAECRVVIIGDTPKDVAAAKGIGAECLGVGTGSFSAQQLLEAGADAAFDTLESPGAFEFLLGGLA